MNVVVLGKGRLAIAIANWFYYSDLYMLTGVVPVLPEPTWDQSLVEWCEPSMLREHSIKVYEKLSDVPPGQDLIFSCFYNKILKKNFIDQHKRVVNLHNGPLPRYRGVNPINWALKNGELKHGVTIHEIDPGIDTGPIIAQVTYSIYPQIEEVKDVYDKALLYGLELFRTTAPIMHKITAIPQNDADALTYTDKDRPNLGDRASWTRKDSK